MAKYQIIQSEFIENFGSLSKCSFCDFRQQWEGYLFNFAIFIEPQPNREMTLDLANKKFCDIVKWISNNKINFSEGDRCQIIVGWSCKVRKNNRQILKGGIEIQKLNSPVADLTCQNFLEMDGTIREDPSWDIGIFNQKEV